MGYFSDRTGFDGRERALTVRQTESGGGSWRYDGLTLLSAILSGVLLTLSEAIISYFGVAPLALSLLSNFVGGMILLLVSYRRRPSFKGWANWRRGGLLALAALTGFGFAYLIYFDAMPRIGGGKVALLGLLQTPFVVVLAILFFGERLSLWGVIAGMTALAGAFFINFDAGALRLSWGIGESEVVVGALLYAVGIVALKPLIAEANAGWITGLAMVAGGIVLVLFVPAFGVSLQIGWAGMGLVIVAGILRAFIWSSYNLSTARAGASRTAILYLSFALFTVFFQQVAIALMPALGLIAPENMGMAILGGLLIIAGIIIFEMKK